MTRRSRASSWALTARLSWADRAVTVLVAVLVLLVALSAALVPRTLDALFARDLDFAVGGLAAPVADVTAAAVFPAGNASGPLGTGTASADPKVAFGRIEKALVDTRAAQPEPLRGSLGVAHVVVPLPAQQAIPPTSVRAPGTLMLVLAGDPDYTRQLSWVAGRAPRTWTGDEQQQDATGPAIEFALSATTAKAMKLNVGDTLQTKVDGADRLAKLVGVFAPRRPASDYWQQEVAFKQAAVAYSPNAPPVYTGTGFVAPGTVSELPTAFSGVNATFWYETDATAVTPGNAELMAQQLRHLVVGGISVPLDDGRPALVAQVTTSLAAAIGDSLARVSATDALLALCASGPAGVVLAVFALGVRAVVARRRATLTLVRARGASPLQLRAAAALEGLAIGVPAAAIGAVIAWLLVPTTGSGAAAWFAPAVVAVLPALLFALLGAPAGFRTTRRDLSAKVRGGLRWGFELAVIVLAALAVVLLLRRGRVSDGLDPLLAITPLLLALAVSIVVLRVLPVLLSAAQLASRRGRGLVAFLGTARAMRDPALGVAAALAVVVGIATAVFSTTAYATVDNGIHSAAETSVGADVRADTDLFTTAQQKHIADSAGVSQVVPLGAAGQYELGVNGRTSTVQVLLAPARELHALRPEVPTDLGTKQGGRIPVLVSADLTTNDVPGLAHSRAKLRLGDVDVVVAGRLPADAQLGANSSWVLVDAAYASRFGLPSLSPDELLITASSPAQIPAAVRAVRAAVPKAAVADVPDTERSQRAAPATAGLRTALYAAALVGALLAAIAVFAASVTAAPARDAIVGMLRTMGLTGRATLGLVVWEILPVALAATAAGTALGLWLPRLLQASTDLGPFTGGTRAVATHIDPLATAAVLAAFLAVTALAICAAVLLARRVRPAGTVKMGAE